MVGRDDDCRTIGDDSDAEFFEYHSDHAHIGEPNVFDADFGTRRGGEPDIGADFEVIGTDGVFGAVKPARAVDGERI